MALNTSRVAEKPVSLLWGCEIAEQSKTASFKVEVEEYEQQQALRARPGSISSGKYDHRLVLNTVCMGEKAKDEFHIIEIVLKAEEGKEAKPVPIACLKPSILPMATLVGLELTPPIIFRLKSGTGPVYISGQHIAVEAECWDGEEEEEEAEEEAEEEEIEISPVKPNKRPAAQKKTGPAKKKKMEEDDFDDDMDSEEDTKKGKQPSARGRKPAANKK